MRIEASRETLFFSLDAVINFDSMERRGGVLTDTDLNPSTS